MKIERVNMGFPRVGSFSIPKGTVIQVPVYDEDTGDQIDTTEVTLLESMHVQSVSSVQAVKVYWERRNMVRDYPFS